MHDKTEIVCFTVFHVMPRCEHVQEHMFLWNVVERHDLWCCSDHMYLQSAVLPVMVSLFLISNEVVAVILHGRSVELMI